MAILPQWFVDNFSSSDFANMGTEIDYGQDKLIIDKCVDVVRDHGESLMHDGLMAEAAEFYEEVPEIPNTWGKICLGLVMSALRQFILKELNSKYDEGGVDAMDATEKTLFQMLDDAQQSQED